MFLHSQNESIIFHINTKKVMSAHDMKTVFSCLIHKCSYSITHRIMTKYHKKWIKLNTKDTSQLNFWDRAISFEDIVRTHHIHGEWIFFFCFFYENTPKTSWLSEGNMDQLSHIKAIIVSMYLSHGCLRKLEALDCREEDTSVLPHPPHLDLRINQLVW
jgi:hypothetical protein